LRVGNGGAIASSAVMAVYWGRGLTRQSRLALGNQQLLTCSKLLYAEFTAFYRKHVTFYHFFSLTQAREFKYLRHIKTKKVCLMST